MGILGTERLILRKFSCDDWKDLYEYLSKKIVVKFEPYEIFNEETCKREAVKRSTDNAFWAVCLRQNNKLIGNIYFQQQEPKEFLNWEIGYVFNPSYYGKGYDTESCQRILDYGFTQLNTRRAVAMCNPDNISSWKLLERLKMRREGHLLKNTFFKYDQKANPIWNDTYKYAILADEWFNFDNLKKMV